VPNPGTLIDPGGAPLPGTGGGEHSRSGIIFVKCADQAKRDGRMAEKGG
jgi:hypothetical protein